MEDNARTTAVGSVDEVVKNSSQIHDSMSSTELQLHVCMKDIRNHLLIKKIIHYENLVLYGN